ncbi:MAG: malonate decarboxylase holo-[acyl-carrier-protein] synthase [Rhodocyclaceae bacterium]|nr:malonate decarboxylase holo-[acyl-carrier-protein] synthase [Rhodocyclaceae bacterium]MCB1954105.1 malonate decarboxylase holo-[acyl-carrier-protein] synthase [Rhodocyclaceae bacterium]
MPETRPRRHDLVWLDPGALERIEVAPDDRAMLAAWLRLERPLVAGRHEAGDARLRLGFTVPGIGARRRIGVLAPRDTLVARKPPPPLAELIEVAPLSWRATLRDLSTAMTATGHVVRAYGSLVNQSIIGEPCLHVASDLDVVVDCADRARAIDALRILDPFADTHPRIDGELRVGGWAVAWRELAAAVDAGRSVLAKSDGAVRLMAADEFLDAVHRVQTDADQRAPDPLAA